MAEDKDNRTSDEANPDEAEMSEAEIDYNVMASFPASDPPSWTLGVSPHKKEHGQLDEDIPSVNDPSHQNEPEAPDDAP